MKRDKIHFAFPLLALTLLLVFSFYLKLSAIPIRIWDEARLANNALHMFLNNNLLVTFYEGAPDMWNTKPPLMIWLQVVSMHIFGINEWAVRFPSATASILTGLFLFLFSKRYLQNIWIGFLSGAVFGSTMAYVIYHAGRTGDYDAVLSFFTTLYCFSFYLFIVHGTKKWMYLFWLFITLAVLTKGIAGLLFLPGLFIFTLFHKKLKRVFSNSSTYMGLVSFIIIVGGYYLGKENANPGYLQAVYENELGGRFLKTLEEHQHPFGYYEDNMRKWRYQFWYWSFIAACVANFFIAPKFKRLVLFNILMTVPYVLIISSGQTKLEWYDIPIYSFCALQIGILLFCLWHRFSILINRRFVTVFSVSIFILLFFWPYKQVYNYTHHFKERWFDVEAHAQSYFLQDAIKQKKSLNNYTFCYEGYNGQINFYIQKLQVEKSKVELQNNTENLQPGSFAVANQETLKKQIEAAYMTEKKEERHGCTVYFIIAKKHHLKFIK